MAFKTLDTLTQYQEITDYCFALYKNKLKDYGCAWRVLRLPSLTDQIYIKANRIRTIENTGIQKIDEGIESELIAIVNYSIIALIQLDHGVSDDVDMNTEQAEEAYLQHKQIVEQLMLAKNHDYGEAWRQMRLSSITDLIIQKILRIKQIEDNSGATLVSEGLDANYQDMFNYAVFSLIRLKENK
ncbi:MAG: DUF1599 domain-containing protein [Flavobacteriales bacterium]